MLAAAADVSDTMPMLIEQFLQVFMDLGASHLWLPILIEQRALKIVSSLSVGKS